MKPPLHLQGKPNRLSREHRRPIEARYRKSPNGRAAKIREVMKRGPAWNEYRRNLRIRKQDEQATRPRPSNCECCDRPAEIRFDHDHTTGKFRGWLCDRCNLGLGKLGDTIQGVRAALAYLERVG